MNTPRVGGCLSALSWTFLFFAVSASGQDTAESPHVASDQIAKTDREQTIYVPFSKLREVFEKEGRGVFLPYEQFQQLWQAARDAEHVQSPSGPPVDSIISQAESQATVRMDVVQVEAKLRIELLKQGWNVVPLRLAGAAIQAASIDGETARITTAEDGGYQLLVENPTEAPQQIELKLTYARAFEKSPGQNSVAFAAPLAPVNRWTIRIPQAGVKVNVAPMIAATEALSEVLPASQGEPTVAGAEETVLLAFVGSAPEVAISWTPKSEGASGMAALVSVLAQQELFASEGAVRTRVTLQYSISRAQLERLTVDVPADHKVVNVFDPNVRKWDVQNQTEDDGTQAQRITVELFEPASSSQSLTIELQKFIDESQLSTVQAPVIRAVGVGRQQGIVVVRVDQALRAETTNSLGLIQLDATDLPPSLTEQSWNFAFRYAAVPYGLEMALEKIQPRIQIEQLVECYVEPELISMDVVARYDIEQAGIFQLEMDLPTGFEILQVRGLNSSGTAAAVDAFHRDESNPDHLIINLSRKALGQVAVLVQLQRRMTDPNLIAPTGTASNLALPIPRSQQEFSNRFAGKVLLYAPESLRLNPTINTGLKAIGLSEAFTELSSARGERFTSTRPVLAFAYADQPTQLEIAAERRSPYVTARQMMIVRIEAGVVKYESLIVFDILYSGVKSLRVDVPSAIASTVRNASGSLRDALIAPQPADVDENYVAWSMTGEAELLGAHRVRLVWEQKIDELAVGNSLDLVLPRIKPMGTDRAWGQVVVTKTETLDVEPTGEPQGLRPIDPVYDVMKDVRVADAGLAFEFFDDWELTLQATRFQLEEVKRTSIERALVRTVVTRSDQQSVQALYRMRSARQRLSVKLPANATFDTQPARVNGTSVALERGDQDLLYVPLSGQDPNSDFLLELRYTVPGNYRQIDMPEFPDNPAVQKVYLAVFLPQELSLLHNAGPWTEEYTWQPQRSLRWTPQAVTSDEELAKWVAEGIQVTAGPAFQKDGLLYLYSALRPEPPPNGSLQLRATHQSLLSGFVIAILAVVGIALLRSPFSWKLAVIAGMGMAAVACGMFAPTFGQQLLNLPMIAGLIIVGIAWSAWGAAATVKQMDWTRQANGSRKATANTVAQAEKDQQRNLGDDASHEPESHEPGGTPASPDASQATEGENHE